MEFRSKLNTLRLNEQLRDQQIEILFIAQLLRKYNLVIPDPLIEIIFKYWKLYDSFTLNVYGVIGDNYHIQGCGRLNGSFRRHIFGDFSFHSGDIQTWKIAILRSTSTDGISIGIINRSMIIPLLSTSEYKDLAFHKTKGGYALNVVGPLIYNRAPSAKPYRVRNRGPYNSIINTLIVMKLDLIKYRLSYTIDDVDHISVDLPKSKDIVYKLAALVMGKDELCVLR